MRPVLDRPVVRMRPGAHRRLRDGHPWAYSNELELDEPARGLAPGAVATLTTAAGEPLATVTFNLHSLIAVRVWDRRPDAALDTEWFRARLDRALALRERLFDRPYYRWVHAEADGMPGIVVDRFDDVLVVQTNTAGSERLLDPLIAALVDTGAPRAIVLRNDSPVRGLEGLGSEVRTLHGTLGGPVEVEEGGCRYRVDPTAGQKTGWFFDLAEARGRVARLARGGRMLDVYCHTGGFAIAAAAAGAREVVAIDRSEAALALARESAERNGVVERCTFRPADAFAALAELSRERREGFDVVVTDPPSFVKSRRELEAGARGYRKLTRLAAGLVAPGGFLFVASCSHHVSPERLAHEIARGLQAARREGRVIAGGGAGPDHPVHPWLPESAYLKYEILQLDGTSGPAPPRD